jgi:hypothetical protein
MKKILTAALFVLFTMASFSQSAATTYAESGFIAQFPYPPKIENDKVDSEIGEIPMKLYLCEGEDFMIMVSENKYPLDMIATLDKPGREQLLEVSKDGAINNIAKQMGGKFESNQNETYLFNNKHTAIKIGGTIKGIPLLANYILRNNQMYQIMMMGNITSEKTTAFFNSFKLIE